MNLVLSTAQHEAYDAFRSFADRSIAPLAEQFDREERVPRSTIADMARHGFLGAALPDEWGGQGLDMVTFGLLNEAIGTACSSMRSLLTVHSMTCSALLRWGKPAQKQQWLPRLASGETIGAFALTEPNIGSDARNIETTAERREHSYVLSGHKRWITFGQIADVFLLFARCDGKPSAFLVERDRPGLSTTPISGMLGTRGSMLAELHLNSCEIPRDNLIGGLGFGVSAVALSALDLGRYSVAWGCVGIAQACLEASLRYASQRMQFGGPLRQHQLIQELIANMTTGVKAARLLCYQAGLLKDRADPSATAETLVAKYFASTTATRIANDAVQIHGANGCSADYPVQRYLRDARVMEIIEGSNQMQQIMISNHAFAEHGAQIAAREERS